MTRVEECRQNFLKRVPWVVTFGQEKRLRVHAEETAEFIATRHNGRMVAAGRSDNWAHVERRDHD